MIIKGTPGFEPGTSPSAVECSNTELYPHVNIVIINGRLEIQVIHVDNLRFRENEGQSSRPITPSVVRPSLRFFACSLIILQLRYSIGDHIVCSKYVSTIGSRKSSRSLVHSYKWSNLNWISCQCVNLTIQMIQ